MIEKMKFINIMGPITDFDRVVQNYLHKYDIQVENALSELKTVRDIKPFVETNPYEGRIKFFEELNLKKELGSVKPNPESAVSIKDAEKIIDKAHSVLTKMIENTNSLQEELQKQTEALRRIEPFRSLRFDVTSILDFRFIKFRFGKFPKEYFDKFEKNVYTNTEAIFLKCYDDIEYVWGVYFVSKNMTDKVDAVFSSLHFERIYIPDEYEGTTEEVCVFLEKQIAQLNSEIEKILSEKTKYLLENGSKILCAYQKTKEYSDSFDLRKVAACTDRHEITYFILCGWISDQEEKLLKKDLEHDNSITCFTEDEHSNIFSTPPTKLKNPKFIRPFEMFIRMYGLPAYNEIDPTIFVALTYAFIFGIMFGDVGQGLCLCIGGFILYKIKKADLAAIISICGIFSTIFGFMFGSIFGFEDLIPALWIRPASYMTQIPFIGKINYIFIVAIGFGMFLILLSMIFNMINSLKEKNLEKGVFDTNGIAGFVFFGSAVLTVILFMTGNYLPGGVILFMMFGIPIIMIALKEPIMNIIQKKTQILPKEKGMYIMQTFFELFEVLLSYFSNTLSFVRIGAFAVSHAAMMEVVLMLAGAESGSPNILVMIIGNVIVCGMEGLIVGIQVLRLEFYELFSRFYRGTGHVFKPFRSVNNKGGF
ncbi:MAG: ATPase [Clostridia bacterium]|nr:ATPase [Clostridia bacterium]